MERGPCQAFVREPQAVNAMTVEISPTFTTFYQARQR